MKSFTEKVYEYTKTIPAGKVATYRDVAIAIGHPQAVRAVANALAKNFDPDIPCHRVIRSDGSMGGYNRGGKHAKKTILIQEGADV